jgi:hypothetical protein
MVSNWLRHLLHAHEGHVDPEEYARSLFRLQGDEEYEETRQDDDYGRDRRRDYGPAR